jgi:hypothetical protein
MWQAVLPQSVSIMESCGNGIPGKLLQMKPNAALHCRPQDNAEV